jgi:catechol 2,3-dioxygenase-like lactoylglutathione lyase family enzyme
MSAPDYGRSLRGLGVNLIVSDLAESLRFATEVLGASIFMATPAFAALKLYGADFMFHADATYGANPLKGSLADGSPRGIGVELRPYGVDPDVAEAAARRAGFTVLAGSLDKPHGLRECMILDPDGYVWIPSVHLEPEVSSPTP